jgi:hypothetical protein
MFLCGMLKIAVDKHDIAYYVTVSYKRLPAKKGIYQIITEIVMSSIVKIWWLLAALLLTSTALSTENAAPLSSKSPQGDPDDIFWDSTIANYNGGLNGPVTALTVYDGKLIVGGDFTTAGGIAVNHIAAWDGQSWSPLGSGLHLISTYADVVLKVWNDQLVVAGSLDSAGGVAAKNIAVWDGASWTPLGTGLDGPVTALSEYDGKIVAGYLFWPCSECYYGAKVSSWDGLTWSLLSTWSGPFNHAYRVTGLAEYYGILKVAIIASHADCSYGWHGLWVFVDKLFIATWESCMAYGIGDLAVCDGDSCSSFATFGQGNWHWVNALEQYDGKLIAAGVFTSAQDVLANYIATWDNSLWSALGSGLNNEVTSLTLYDSKLAVGGRFTTAGGKISPYLAVWTKRYLQCGDADGSGEVNLADIVYSVNWMFVCGPAPVDENAGDYNCDGRPNIADAVYLINYIFRGGPQPCEACK